MRRALLSPGPKRRGEDLRGALDDLREALYPYRGGGAKVWHPVKIRPSLRFTMVPAPRERRPASESEAVAQYRRQRQMWPPVAVTPEGSGFIEGGQPDALTPADVPEVARRGMGGLTRYGAGRIEDLCALFKREARTFAFWTVTLPPEAAAAMELGGVPWARFQDTIRRRFAEALTRAAARPRYRRTAAGRRPEWLFVVEAQKNGRPHLHFVFRARWATGQPWMLGRDRLDRLIGNAIRATVGIEVSTRSAGNVQMVKRGLGRYLSKYLRKAAGSSQVALIEAAGYGPGMVPTAWWGCCRESRGLLERYTFALPTVMANLLSSRRGGLVAAGVVRATVVDLPGDGAPTVVVGEWLGTGGLRAVIEDLASVMKAQLGCPHTLYRT